MKFPNSCGVRLLLCVCVGGDLEIDVVTLVGPELFRTLDYQFTTRGHFEIQDDPRTVQSVSPSMTPPQVRGNLSPRTCGDSNFQLCSSHLWHCGADIIDTNTLTDSYPVNLNRFY